jgi:hypothetical protein
MDKWLKLIWQLKNTIGCAENILWSKEINYIKERNEKKMN